MNPSQSISPMNGQDRAAFASCLLELRDRVEALEAAQHAHVDLSHLSDAEREQIRKQLANPGRFEALEAAQQAHADASHVIDPEREKMAQKLSQDCGFAPRSSEVELRAATRLHSYKVGKAKPIENWGFGHTLVDPPVYAKAPKDAKPADSPPQPNHPEFPDSSLKERIRSRMIQGFTWDVTAASVLAEVAAWLDTVKQFDAAALLRLEAER